MRTTREEADYMIEYKVVTVPVKIAEETMNEYATEGWQVVATTSSSVQGFTVNSSTLIITFGRKK